jgi:hypothetical protein
MLIRFVQILQKWDFILKNCYDNLNLWKEYLNFRQTHFVSFIYSDCLKVFQECMNTIRMRMKTVEMGKKHHKEGNLLMNLFLFLFIKMEKENNLRKY